MPTRPQGQEKEGDGVEMAIGAHPVVMIFVVQSPSRYVFPFEGQVMCSMHGGGGAASRRSCDKGMNTHL